MPLAGREGLGAPHSSTMPTAVRDLLRGKPGDQRLLLAIRLVQRG